LNETGWGSLEAFDLQMERIKNLDLTIFDKPIVIETLNNRGRKNEDAIVAEIFEAVKAYRLAP
jgi:hypothetical protein